MSTIPRADQETIAFYTVRAERWREDPERVGLTQAEADLIADLAESARKAYAEAMLARTLAASATASLDLALKALRGRGGLAISAIRTHAAINDESGVLSQAGLPAPSRRRAPIPPAQPVGADAELLSSGALRVHWKVRHTQETRAEGTVYRIERRLITIAANGEALTGRWEFLGLAAGIGRAGKEFVDRTIPMGWAGGSDGGEGGGGGALIAAEYLIVPQRAGIVGVSSNILHIGFGSAAPQLTPATAPPTEHAGPATRSSVTVRARRAPGDANRPARAA